MSVSITITITGPDQPSLDAAIAAFAASKGWRPGVNGDGTGEGGSGLSAVEFSRIHLAAYFDSAVQSTALAQLAAKHAAESAAVQEMIAAQVKDFTVTVE